jgi:hypothetical protein
MAFLDLNQLLTAQAQPTAPAAKRRLWVDWSALFRPAIAQCWRYSKPKKC